MNAITKRKTSELAEIVRGRFAELLDVTPRPTQRAIADGSKVPLAIVNRTIRGDGTPSPDALKKFAMFFGVTTDWLLGLPDAPKKRRSHRNAS